MDLQEAIKTLKEHNEWRRDREIPSKIKMLEPFVIGKALDLAIEVLSKVLEEQNNPISPIEVSDWQQVGKTQSK